MQSAGVNLSGLETYRYVLLARVLTVSDFLIQGRSKVKLVLHIRGATHSMVRLIFDSTLLLLTICCDVDKG